MTPSGSIELQWLEKIITPPLESTLLELVKGARESGWPDHLESAVNLLQDVLSQIAERRHELDDSCVEISRYGDAA